MTTIVEEINDGAEAALTYPPCPKCGTKGVFLYQTSEIIDGFFTIVDVYACPKCQPELLEKG